MPLQLVTAPTAEPVSLTEARAHLRAPSADTTQDALIGGLIAAARAAAETRCQRQIIAARWQLVLDSFPGQADDGSAISYVPWGKTYGIPPNAILLPICPVLQVVSISYLDMAGVTQPLVVGQANDYVVQTAGQVARITPPFGKIWPANVMPQIGAVTVTFDAGDAALLTASPGADTISVPGWKTQAVADPVRLSNRDGAFPGGLSAQTDFFVRSMASPNVYTLSASSGGALLDITSAGTGESFIGVIPQGLKAWMLMAIGALYENRESIAVDTRITSVEVPKDFLDGLLDPYRLVLY